MTMMRSTLVMIPRFQIHADLNIHGPPGDWIHPGKTVRP
jgi:hypothetical protein